MKLEIEVKVNPKRRRPILMVFYHNRVLIEFPKKEDISDLGVNSIIEEHREWIEKRAKINETSTLEIYEKDYDFVSGTLIFIKGERFQLKVIKVKKAIEESIMIDGRVLFCRIRKVDKTSVRNAIKSFLYPKADELIKDKVKYWSERIGVSYDKVFLKEYKTSWGHVRDNDLYFDWRVIFLSERLLTYLVIHEVLHFIYRDHGNKFLEKLKSLSPDHLELEKKLKEQRYIIYRF